MTILDGSVSRSFEGGPSFSLRNRLTRLAWMVTWALLARWTPRQLKPWRRWLACAFGADLGEAVHIYGSCRIWLPSHLRMGAGSTLGPRVNCYNLGLIAIGENTVISQGAHLCSGTHDHRDPGFQLVSRPVRIGDRVWIAAEAFVAPGVTVGDGAVLGARGCAMSDLEPWTVYAGNPAQAMGSRAMRSQ